MAVEQMHRHCVSCEKQTLMERKGTNHVLHLLLTLVTMGFWIIIWILSCIKVGGWKCTVCGKSNGSSYQNKSSSSFLVISGATLIFFIAYLITLPKPHESSNSAIQNRDATEISHKAINQKVITLDGAENGNIIAPKINVWKDYQNRSRGAVTTLKHGDRVDFIQREGEGVLIRTPSGEQGWVSSIFIKEFK